LRNSVNTSKKNGASLVINHEAILKLIVNFGMMLMVTEGATPRKFIRFSFVR
jgi:hypothetical protein